MSIKEKIKNNCSGFRAAIIGGFWGGMIASFVKWGTEIPFPPRTPDRAVPPIEVLKDFGFPADSMVYTYSGRIVNWGSAGVHQLFSVFFGIVYALIIEYFCPRLTIWQGFIAAAIFGIAITIIFHGIIVPLMGIAPPLWALPCAELFSETFGHIVWAWTIEVFRQYYRDRYSAG